MAGRWTFVLVIALACAMVTAQPNPGGFLTAGAKTAPEVEKKEPAAPKVEKKEPAAPTRAKTAPEVEKKEPAAPKVEKKEPAAPKVEKKEPAAPTRAKTLSLFKQLDQNEDNKLSAREINAYFKAYFNDNIPYVFLGKKSISLKWFSEALWTTMDKKRNNELDEEEISGLFNSKIPPVGFWEHTDADNNGVISFEEFTGLKPPARRPGLRRPEAARTEARFATGMIGDEDLGQDIIMKGKPFHY